MKKGYNGNIEKLTLKNEDFRKVLYTANNCQLVLMSLKPGEDIGLYDTVISQKEYQDKPEEIFINNPTSSQ